jgi:CubicO group peptidase (beta-lactamase class C family)
MTRDVQARVRAAADRVLTELAADSRYAYTSSVLIWLDSEVVVAEHLHAPRSNDVFSVTKSVLATVLGVMAQQGRLPALDTEVSAVLPELRGTPAEHHSWKHLLTMTRGARTDGPWDADELTALSGGLVARIAAAPQVRTPGTTFRYDQGGVHLLSAAAAAVLGEPLSAYAWRELFKPLGFTDAEWACDQDGNAFGYAHLRLRPTDLARLGQLWLDGGSAEGRQLVEPTYLRAMTRAHSAGGPPEDLPYGYLTWIGQDYVMAGGWAGQHLLVLPSARAVLVTTGDPGFEVGPPPTDRLPADWAPALTLLRRHLLPVLRAASQPE